MTTQKSSKPSGQESLMVSLAMLDMIPKVGKISAPEIRQRLQNIGYIRSDRSVQRHLVALTETFPIECDVSSKPYGYKWTANSPGISVPGLTLQEALLMNMAEKYLRNLLPPSVNSAMQAFFNQARMNLGHASDPKLERRWVDKVRVVSQSMPLLAPEIRSDVLQAVSSALYYDHWLDLDYANVRGERKVKRVMPLGLAQQGARMILVVRFENYEDERSLALNRIHSAHDTGLKFKTFGFDFAKYDDDGRFGLGSGKEIKLKFRIEKISGTFLTESRLSKDQHVKDLGDWLEITATVVHSAQLVWWLRGFGKRIEIQQPASLLNSYS